MTDEEFDCAIARIARLREIGVISFQCGAFSVTLHPPAPAPAPVHETAPEPMLTEEEMRQIEERNMFWSVNRG